MDIDNISPPQILMLDDKPVFAVMPIDDYNALIEALED